MEDFAYYKLAAEVEDNKGGSAFAYSGPGTAGIIAGKFLQERKNQAYYNSVAVLDADGSILGVYRKAHVPTGPGYEEKFYFNP